MLLWLVQRALSFLFLFLFLGARVNGFSSSPNRGNIYGRHGCIAFHPTHNDKGKQSNKCLHAQSEKAASSSRQVGEEPPQVRFVVSLHSGDVRITSASDSVSIIPPRPHPHPHRHPHSEQEETEEILVTKQKSPLSFLPKTFHRRQGNGSPNLRSRGERIIGPPASIPTSIQSAIEKVIKKPKEMVLPPTSPPKGFTGLSEMSHRLLQNPMPGTVLLDPEDNPRPPVTVRIATTLDDENIANLRLSVFSDFPPDVRKQFCSRSCQVLASRRTLGATCLVATTPTNHKMHATKIDSNTVVLGSIECSIHEFFNTKLGLRRHQDSILYVTEVAVHPLYRRCGIGTKLMKALDQVALMRNVESLYLHVDVTNKAALALYAKLGYHLVDQKDPMYKEFTKNLNLHDGATKGRKHYLLCKDVVDPIWLPLVDKDTETAFSRAGTRLTAPPPQQQQQQATIGFEIPA